MIRQSKEPTIRDTTGTECVEIVETNTKTAVGASILLYKINGSMNENGAESLELLAVTHYPVAVRITCNDPIEILGQTTRPTTAECEQI